MYVKKLNFEFTNNLIPETSILDSVLGSPSALSAELGSPSADVTVLLVVSADEVVVVVESLAISSVVESLTASSVVEANVGIDAVVAAGITTVVEVHAVEYAFEHASHDAPLATPSIVKGPGLLYQILLATLGSIDNSGETFLWKGLEAARLLCKSSGNLSCSLNESAPALKNVTTTTEDFTETSTSSSTPSESLLLKSLSITCAHEYCS